MLAAIFEGLSTIECIKQVQIIIEQAGESSQGQNYIITSDYHMRRICIILKKYGLDENIQVLPVKTNSSNWTQLIKERGYELLFKVDPGERWLARLGKKWWRNG